MELTYVYLLQLFSTQLRLLSQTSLSTSTIKKSQVSKQLNWNARKKKIVSLIRLWSFNIYKHLSTSNVVKLMPFDFSKSSFKYILVIQWTCIIFGMVNKEFIARILGQVMLLSTTLSFGGLRKGSAFEYPSRDLWGREFLQNYLEN